MTPKNRRSAGFAAREFGSIDCGLPLHRAQRRLISLAGATEAAETDDFGPPAQRGPGSCPTREVGSRYSPTWNRHRPDDGDVDPATDGEPGTVEGPFVIDLRGFMPWRSAASPTGTIVPVGRRPIAAMASAPPSSSKIASPRPAESPSSTRPRAPTPSSSDTTVPPISRSSIRRRAPWWPGRPWRIPPASPSTVTRAAATPSRSTTAGARSPCRSPIAVRPPPRIRSRSRAKMSSSARCRTR